MRVSHLTPVIALLLAAAWRWRDARGAPGALVGLAVSVKFFVWPLAVWLVATRRYRDALLTVVIAAASLLLVLPYTSLVDYGHALNRVGRVFDQDSYNVYGCSCRPGSATPAPGLEWSPSLSSCSRRSGATRASRSRSPRRSLLSPISWLDYYALAALPLAMVRPRLSLVWFLPILTWGLEGAGIGIGDAASTVRLLVVFGVVFAVAFRGERSLAAGVGPAGA